MIQVQLLDIEQKQARSRCAGRQAGRHSYTTVGRPSDRLEGREGR